MGTLEIDMYIEMYIFGHGPAYLAYRGVHLAGLDVGALAMQDKGKGKGKGDI